MAVSSLLGELVGIRPTLYLEGIFYALAGLLAFAMFRRARLPVEEKEDRIG